MNTCPFCDVQIDSVTLWKSEHYRIIADEFPRCVGHLLLITKGHFASHMHVPVAWLPELKLAQEIVRSFLLATFGKASFLENGGIRQEVPHAHLHCVPFNASLPLVWVNNNLLKRVNSWEEIHQECEKIGHYCYVEGINGNGFGA